MAGYAGLWLIAAAVLGPHTISALAAMRSYRAIKLGFPRVCPECEYDNRSMETDVDVLTCPECGVTYTGDEVADLTKSFWRVWKSRGTRESSLWIKRESLVKSRQALKQYNDELKQRVETDPG